MKRLSIHSFHFQFPAVSALQAGLSRNVDSAVDDVNWRVRTKRKQRDLIFLPSFMFTQWRKYQVVSNPDTLTAPKPKRMCMNQGVSAFLSLSKDDAEKPEVWIIHDSGRELMWRSKIHGKQVSLPADGVSGSPQEVHDGSSADLCPHRRRCCCRQAKRRNIFNYLRTFWIFCMLETPLLESASVMWKSIFCRSLLWPGSSNSINDTEFDLFIIYCFLYEGQDTLINIARNVPSEATTVLQL